MMLPPSGLDVAERHLRSTDPDLAALVDRVGPCLLPVSRREPFEALLRAIAHQQLHARAAEAILGRFLALFPGEAFPAPHDIAGADDAAIRGCGFSASKLAAIRDICVRAADGTVPTAIEADALPDEELIRRLTTLRGVGRWTVEMLLIFTLGRPDVLPVDDYGVREGWRLIKRLSAQPKPRDLAAIGATWSPFRSIAAWYLWRASDEGKKIR